MKSESTERCRTKASKLEMRKRSETEGGMHKKDRTVIWIHLILIHPLRLSQFSF